MAGRATQSWPIYIRELEVLESYDVTPRMRRVVLTGEQLGAHERDGHRVGPFRTENADDHVKLVILDGSPSVQAPTQDDGHLDWTPEALGLARDYTPRRFDPEEGRLELDFVRHDGGLASSWAERAEPGDRIHVAGPRGTTLLPDGIEWYFLAGDETALPAIARRIEELPAGTPVTAVVSVPTSGEEQDLKHDTDLEIHWVPRDTGGPDAFMEAVRDATWRNGQVYAWAAGEAGLIRPLRTWFAKDRGVPRSHIDIAGYWRAGSSQAEGSASLDRFRQAIDLAFPYAMRAAVTLGFAEHVMDGATSVAAVAHASGAQERGVRKVLRVLAHWGLFVIGDDDSVTITPLGTNLTEDFVHGHIDRASGYSRLDDSWPALLHSLRTGESAYEHVHGHSLWEEFSRDSSLGDSFDEYLAGWSTMWAEAAAKRIGPVPGRLVDVGGGKGMLIAEVLSQSPEATATLVELPTTAARARDELARRGLADRVDYAEQSFFEPIPTGGDVYVLAQVLHDWPDAEAEAILRRVCDAAGDARVVLIERFEHAGAHDHDLSLDLQMYATFGGGERTREEFARLAERVGRRVTEVFAVTDDLNLIELSR